MHSSRKSESQVVLDVVSLSAKWSSSWSYTAVKHYFKKLAHFKIQGLLPLNDADLAES